MSNRKSKSPAPRWSAPHRALLGAVLCVASSVAFGQETMAADGTVRCRLLYETVDGFFVDLGVDSGVRVGAEGWLMLEDQRVVRIQVRRFASGSAFLRTLSAPTLAIPTAGTEIMILFDPGSEAAPVERPDHLQQPLQEDPFEPLLAPRQLKQEVETGSRNVFHGRLDLQQFFQLADDGDFTSSRTRLRSSGSVDRIQGTPWALEWSASVTYRDGRVLRDVRDYRTPGIEVTRLSLFRPYRDKSFVRLGRFIPRELPAVGYLDGVQGEHVVNDRWRFGALFGVKPEREDLDMSTDEPTVVPYLTYERRGDDTYYSTTAGILFSYFESQPDRLAILHDQLLRWGEWSWSSGSEIDFDLNNEVRNDPARLTRLNLFGNRALWEGSELRCGADRFEIPDTEAERDQFNIVILPEAEFFKDSYWRFYVGGRHRVGERWTLSEEVSYIDGESDDALRWSVGASRRGLWSYPSAVVTLNLFNLFAENQLGYGGRLSGYLPLNDSFALEPSIGVRIADFEDNPDNSLFIDGAMNLHWQLDSRWSFICGGNYSYTDDVQRVSFLINLGYRW